MMKLRNSYKEIIQNLLKDFDKEIKESKGVRSFVNNEVKEKQIKIEEGRGIRYYSHSVIITAHPLYKDCLPEISKILKANNFWSVSYEYLNAIEIQLDDFNREAAENIISK